MFGSLIVETDKTADFFSPLTFRDDWFQIQWKHQFVQSSWKDCDGYSSPKIIQTGVLIHKQQFWWNHTKKREVITHSWLRPAEQARGHLVTRSLRKCHSGTAVQAGHTDRVPDHAWNLCFARFKLINKFWSVIK